MGTGLLCFLRQEILFSRFFLTLKKQKQQKKIPLFPLFLRESVCFVARHRLHEERREDDFEVADVKHLCQKYKTFYLKNIK